MSAAFSDFGGLWLCGYALFALSLYLCMFYIPQFPIRRRLLQKREEILAHVNSVKAKVLEGELTPSALDDLIHIFDTEDRIMRMGTDIPGARAYFVETAAVLSAAVPFITALLQVYASKAP